MKILTINKRNNKYKKLYKKNLIKNKRFYFKNFILTNYIYIKNQVVLLSKMRNQNY